jgi:predicted metalloprotease with PDZ domain
MALMGATSSNGRGKEMAGVIGISLQQQGNAFAVVGVLNGMPADEAGITRYMRIAAIDGISVSEMTIDQGMAACAAPLAAPCR